MGPSVPYTPSFLLVNEGETTHMHTKSPFRLLLALFLGFALVAAACGDDDDDPEAGGDTTTEGDDPTTTEGGGDGEEAAFECPNGTEVIAAGEPAASQEGEEVPKSESVGGDGVLDFGTILPETGDLAFLGPPRVRRCRPGHQRHQRSRRRARQ